MVIHWKPLIGILLYFTNCRAESTCCERVSLSYLDAAVDMIGKAKQYFPPSGNCENNRSRNALDCSELFEMGYKKSGVYKVWPQSRVVDGKPLEVYCDMDTDGGGWTLIQRRGPFGGGAEDFSKNWKSYKEGFGDLEKEFWLGNANIFALTSQKLYSARFDLRRDDITKYAHYDTFWIDDESNKYTLHIANYSGTAGDSMIEHHNDQKFSAIDEDNDSLQGANCVESYKGGWWYNACYDSNLNGLYIKGALEAWTIHWNSWTKFQESLQATEIKIRPRNFKRPRLSGITVSKWA